MPESFPPRLKAMTSRSGTPTDTQAAAPPFREVIRVAELSRQTATRVDIRPGQEDLREIADFLELLALRRLRLKGEIRPWRASGWRAELRLTADLDQACVVTLDPVPEKIDEKVVRTFLPRAELPDTPTIDLSLDDEEDPDPFDDGIDFGQIAVEALSLAVSAYPRSAEDENGRWSSIPPGAVALTEERLKPFAKLASLKEKLERGES